MKLKNLLTILCLTVITIGSVFAQKRFILENKGVLTNTRIFDNLDSAVAAIQTDDILYIPGGNFGLPSSGMIIDKNGVDIIGAGHHPDSTTATERTYLTGDITVNADYVSISGIYLSGNIFVDGVASNPMITGFALKNSNVNSILLRDNASSPETELSSISNNIIRGSVGGGFTSSTSINHNIMEFRVSEFNGSGVYFSYNIFLYVSSYNKLCNDVDGATFTRNIFRGGNGNIFTNNSNNNTLNDCSMSTANPISYVLIGTNVFNNISLIPTFVGGSLPSTFDYAFDFHHSGGDVGIYGGSGFSFKPRNPHIKTANISTKTNTNGGLQIYFEVEAKQ